MEGFWQRIVARTLGARAGTAIVACMTALLAVAGSAQASVKITSFATTPSTTLAGGHPDLTVQTSFSYSDSTDDLKSLQVYFPAGLLGNPSVVSQCSSAQLQSDTCPAGSKIGSVTVTATAVGIPLPVTAPGDVYVVTPTGSEPARIGMVVRPLGGVLGKTTMSGPVDIRIPGDLGLVTTFDNLPRTLPPLLGTVAVPITINSISLTLNGLVNGGTAAFMTNPTSCGPASSAGLATSYESSSPTGAFAGFTPTDCAHVPFSPSIGFSFGTPQAGAPSALTVNVNVPAAELPRRQSHLRSNVVFLPQGTAINPAAFAGLVPCTDAQLNISSAAAATCPAASQVGTVTFSTPLLGDVPGQVFFGAGTAANPLRLFIQINIKGKNAKLIANNSFFGSFIATSLSNLPQVPFTTFSLTFHGGANALVLAPPCGTDTGFASFTPWSGNPAIALASSVTISQTSTGAPCPAAASAKRNVASAIVRDLAASPAASLQRDRLMGTLTRVLARHHLHRRHRALSGTRSRR
jgi:hypothetical protein